MERLNSGYLTAQMSRTIGVTAAAVAALVAVVPASAAGSVLTSVAKPALRAGGAAAGTHGTFTRTEHFNIRYTDGFTNHYSVKFAGAFRAGGVPGTLRASVRFTKRGGGRYYLCHSGTQAWAARL